jgi:hypothetical protein
MILFIIIWAVELRILLLISLRNPLIRERAMIKAATPMAIPMIETSEMMEIKELFCPFKR